MENKKPNCYKCKYRGTVAGSCHSCCSHPSLEDVNNDSMLGLISKLGGGGMSPIATKDSIKAVGRPQGIRGGWFSRPFNFDPTWLLECDGFEPKGAG